VHGQAECTGVAAVQEGKLRSYGDLIYQHGFYQRIVKDIKS